MPDIDLAQVFISFAGLLFSLTVHEAAHAWTANRPGDSTARLLGRVSLNPLVHADPIGTIVFPLVAMISNAPLIGWAKPVPVNVRQMGHPRRDYILVAAAGPFSNFSPQVSKMMEQLSKGYYNFLPSEVFTPNRAGTLRSPARLSKSASWQA